MLLIRAIPVSRRSRRLLRGTVGVIVSALAVGCAAVTGTPIAADLRDVPISGSSQPVGDFDDTVRSAAAEASSRQLIDAALAAGEIDEPTWWLYRTWLTFDEQLVPEQYLGAHDAHDTELLVEMPRLLPDFADDIRQQIEPYFLRPTDPRSIFSAGGDDPPGLRAAMNPAMRDPAGVHVTATNATGNRCQDGWETVAVPGALLRVWACADLDRTRLDGTGLALDTVSGMLAGVAPRMIADMGPLIPDQPDSDPDPRSDNRIDVYLVPPNAHSPSRNGLERPSAEYAYAMSALPYTDKTASGFIIFNHELLSDPGLAERALVHELFHILQYTHNAFLASRWFFEASAEWASAYYVRHDARRLHRVRVPVLQEASPQLLQNPLGLVPYGAYLWPLFMEQEVGAGSVFATWRALGGLTSAGNDDDVIAVLSQQLDVADSFPEFVMRLYNANLPGDPILKRFWHLDASFPDGLVPQRSAETLDDELLTIDYDTVFGTGFVFTPVEVVPPPTADPDDEVFVTVVGEMSVGHAGQPSLEALVRTGDGTYERHIINYSGDGTRICVSQELILVLANQSPQGASIAHGTIGLVRDEEPGCTSIEVTHPGTGERMADHGDKVTVSGIEDDDEPDHMPLVITVFDAPRDSVADFEVEVTLSGGTLSSPREMSWALSEFAAGPNDIYRMETVIALDIDLSDANRPMTIEAVLLELGDDVDEHTPVVELHGEEQDECLLGQWVISAGEMERFYNSVQNDAEFTVRGSTGLSFTEGEYEYTPNLAVRMEISQEAFPISAVMSLTGSIEGRYRADGSVITTSHELASISATVKIGDQTIDGTPMFGDFMTMSPINSAPYECTDAGPILMFATGGPNRVPIQLVPHG